MFFFFKIRNIFSEVSFSWYLFSFIKKIQKFVFMGHLRRNTIRDCNFNNFLSIKRSFFEDKSTYVSKSIFQTFPFLSRESIFIFFKLLKAILLRFILNLLWYPIQLSKTRRLECQFFWHKFCFSISIFHPLI